MFPIYVFWKIYVPVLHVTVKQRAPFFFPPRMMARIDVSIILAKGVGPLDAPPKLDFKG